MNKSVLGVVLLCLLGVPCASAGVIYTLGAGDGMAVRDWASGVAYWVDTDEETIVANHNSAVRQWARGLVIFDISSLAGMTLAGGSATYHFYSFGFSGVNLQYANASGPEVTTDDAWAAGGNIASLGASGWQLYNVTSLLQASINTPGVQYVAFVFNAVVGGSGSLAASEDNGGRGSYLDIAGVGDVPEPASMALLALGLGVLAGAHRWRPGFTRRA